jgi:hypothetical protein
MLHRHLEGFPAKYVAIFIVVLTIVMCALVADSGAEWAMMTALILAATVFGALVGVLIGAPGAEGGDSGTAAANKAGWASRLGVFGTWLTGAAFALVVVNASDIVDWFSRQTEAIATSNGQLDSQLRYTLSALLIAAVVLGLLGGFFGMVTLGRTAISDAEKRAGEAADKAEQAANRAETAKQELLEIAQRGNGARETVGAVQRSGPPPPPPGHPG